MKLATLDFETHAIANRPAYPPKPVGIAMLLPSGESKYLAWGHPSENNCSEHDAKRIVSDIVTTHETIWHNAKFDLEVLEVWTGIKMESFVWHDTMLLAFLNDPHSDTLALKPLSEKLLNMPPDERDSVRDWITTYVAGAKRKPSSWGAYICEAPGGLVGEYAIGDVVRTQRLFDKLLPIIKEEGMMSAYARERKLIPIMIRNEQQGIKCDVEILQAHAAGCQEDFEKVDAYIRKYLNAPGLNLDEDTGLADVLEREGKIKEWVKTETGARSTSKPALAKMLTDRLLYAALMYRGSMATCLRTFMNPWLDLAASNRGYLYTTWNTTRQEEKGGTRTGRLSSSKPLNLQNIPNDFDEKLGGLFEETGLYEEIGIDQLPNMRNYIIADTKDHVLLGRDFASQEPRTFAHYEQGWLRDEYVKDPNLDVYKALVAIVKDKGGMDITRKMAKTIFLGILYGMGITKLADQLGIEEGEARKIKDALLASVPSIRSTTRTVTDLLIEGKGVWTWGQRKYLSEPSKQIKTKDGGTKRITFEYKGVNLLCQGSAADETKEAVIRLDASLPKDARLLLTVHDEIVIVSPVKSQHENMAILKTAMESLELNVPMLSTGESGYRWGGMNEVP